MTVGDTDMPLSEQWTDGADTQNDNAYLMDVLGAAGGGSGVVSSHMPDTGTFLKTFNISYAGTLYDVTIGTSRQQVHLNTLSGTEHITLPVLSPDATIFLYAASKRNGPINIVSGTPTPAPGALVDPLKPVVGSLDYADSLIPLYNGANLIPEIPLSQLRSDGQFKQLAKVSRGALVNTSVQISNSDYYATDEIDWPDKNSGTFTDADGDVYTVQLTRGGTASVILDDLDGDGKGSISQVLLENTTARSALTIKVKTPRGGAGDGKVEIGEIIAPELGQISATSSDLVGKGIQITDLLGTLKINDIADDSAVWAGGNRSQRSTLQAHVIGDGVEISLGSEIRSFKAASVGQATIEAPGIGTMTIMGDRAMGLPGDFAANVTLGTTLGLATTLSSVRILGDMSGSDWDIASGQTGTFSVIGTVSDSLIRTGGSLRSFSAGEMTSSNLYVGIHKSFTALGGSGGELPNQISQMDDAVLGKVVIDEGELSDSNIAARRIGSVTIKAGAYDNGGVLFGLSADSIDKLKVLDIPLSLTRLGAAQTLTEENFRVLVL